VDFLVQISLHFSVLLQEGS